MKKPLTLLLTLALAAVALVSCTKATVADPAVTKAAPGTAAEALTDENGQTVAGSKPENTTAFTPAHLGETAKAEDGSVYAVGETVTAENGEKRIAQPVTNRSGELIGVTLATPEAISEQQSRAQALEQAEASYTGRTNRQRITTTIARGTSPNRLTSRPTLPETEPKSVRLPETLPPYSVPETTVAPEKVKVSYPGVLSYTENGVKSEFRIDSHKVSAQDNGFVVELSVLPLSTVRETTVVRLGYDCYDAEGNKLNEKAYVTRAVLTPNGNVTRTVAPLPKTTARVEFFEVKGQS